MTKRVKAAADREAKLDSSDEDSEDDDSDYDEDDKDEKTKKGGKQGAAADDDEDEEEEETKGGTMNDELGFAEKNRGAAGNDSDEELGDDDAENEHTDSGEESDAENFDFVSPTNHPINYRSR